MIQFFNPLYTDIKTAVTATYPTINIGRKIPRIDATFPAVILFPIENSTYLNSLTSMTDENHIVAGVQVEIFSNQTDTGEYECETIFSVVDQAMLTAGFVRISYSFIPTQNEAITRLVARYRAVISKDLVVYHK